VRRWSMLALMLFVGCTQQPSQSAQTTSESAKMLGENPSKEMLFAPLLDPNAIDGRTDGQFGQKTILFRCPVTKNLDAVLKELWSLNLEDIETYENRRKTDPQIEFAGTRMMGRVAQMHCKPHHRIVAVDKVLAWEALDGKQYVNWDRWIAFNTKPPINGYYLVWSGSVD
jgi:hypothetical protein